MYTSANRMSPPIEEVYFVKKIDDEWLTFFRNKDSLFVGKLKRNWLGSWQLVDDTGEWGILATTYYPQDNEGVVWGASGVGKRIAYYFGMVSNPSIEKIIVEAQGKGYQDIPFIEEGGERFFFLRAKGYVTPYFFKALSKDGENIAPRPPE